MAATTPKLPQNLRDIWTDMYSLHANFNDMGNTVEEWTAYWKTAVSIVKKHNDNKLAHELALAISEYLDSERKQMAKEEAECRAGIRPEGQETGEQNSPNSQSESKQPCQLGMF